MLNNSSLRQFLLIPQNDVIILFYSRNLFQLTLFSPKLQLLQCPLCDHHCENPSKLEEHVNRVHFDPQSPKAENDEAAIGELYERFVRKRTPAVPK